MQKTVLSRLFRPKRLLFLGLALAMAALGTFTWFAWHLVEVTKREARQELSNLASVLAEHSSRSIQAADLILRGVATTWTSIGPLTDPVLRERLRERIVDRLSHTPQARAVLVLDADGNAVVDSASTVPRPFNGADREYYTVHRDSPSVGMYIGKPVKSRLNGLWAISLSRRITAPDGSFAGVVVVALEPKYFEDFHGSLTLGAGSSVSLYRDDGVLLTSWPHRESAIGTIDPGMAAMFTALTHGEAPQVQNAVPPGDKVEHMQAFLRRVDSPLVVAVSTPIAALVEPVTESSVVMVAAGGAIGAGLVLLFVLLSRHLALKDALARRLAEDKAAAVSGWQAAVESEKLKTLFWNSIGHDLRSPLCAMQSFIELVLSEKTGGLSAAQKEYLAHASRAVQMQFSLIDDLLDSARLESGRVSLEEEEVDLILLVEQVADIIQPEADQHGITFVPRRDGPEVTVWGDHRRLMRVVLNIVSNAVKYTPSPGTVTLEHDIRPDGDVAIVVTDTGVGMTRGEIEQAMQAYARVDNEMTRSRQGSGLGLSIARGLIELHDGALTIDSRPGRGTRVTIHIPAARVRAESEPTPALRLAGE